MPQRPLTVVALSDTHDLHRDVVVPDGDLLIHAGDITFFSSNPRSLSDFNDWLGELPHRHKVVIPGNHDSLLLDPANRKTITNAKLLLDSGTTVEGYEIWGSPVTRHADTAFGLEESAARTAHWARLPRNLDILITHGPPHRILDRAPGETFHDGDPQLRAAVIQKRPRLHVFGHVHRGYGTLATQHTLFVNAALPDELGDLEHRPYQLRLNPRSELLE